MPNFIMEQIDAKVREFMADEGNPFVAPNLLVLCDAAYRGLQMEVSNDFKEELPPGGLCEFRGMRIVRASDVGVLCVAYERRG